MDTVTTVDFESFANLAERLAAEIPAPLLADLNGGVIVERRSRRRPDDPPGVYLLGEYVTDEYLGATVYLYHGSFRRLFAGEPAAVWERELRTTLLHEVRHHVEARAGVADLELEDLAELARLWRESGTPPREETRRGERK